MTLFSWDELMPTSRQMFEARELPEAAKDAAARFNTPPISTFWYRTSSVPSAIYLFVSSGGPGIGWTKEIFYAPSRKFAVRLPN